MMAQDIKNEKREVRSKKQNFSDEKRNGKKKGFVIRLRRRPRTSVLGGRRRIKSNNSMASARFRQKLSADEFLRSQRRKCFGEAESFKGTTDFSPWGSIISLFSAQRSFIFTFYFLLLTSFLFPGCGYTTKSTLPKNINTIRVEPFKNSIDFTSGSGRNIYFPLLEVKARNAVIDRFLFDGNLKVVEPETADLVLEGELKSYQRSALRYTDDDEVQEYRVHVTVSFRLTDTRSGEISWSEPNFVGEATYFVTGPSVTSEDSAVEAAIRDLARRIVERTIEDW